MCNRYKAPSKAEEEISIETIKKLPKMYFTNITGGEPFLRTYLLEVGFGKTVQNKNARYPILNYLVFNVMEERFTNFV